MKTFHARGMLLRATYAIAAVVVMSLSSPTAGAYRTSPLLSGHATAVASSASETQGDGQSTPAYHGYRGVTINMTADEVHAKLGTPSNADDTSETYMRSDSECTTVYYDGNRKAIAVSTTYSGANAGAPDPATVFGVSVTPKADGSISEMVRYERAGYWVSYNKVPGDPPCIVITMQRLKR